MKPSIKSAIIELALMFLGAFLIFIGLTIFLNANIVGGIATLIAGCAILLIALAMEDVLR